MLSCIMGNIQFNAVPRAATGISDIDMGFKAYTFMQPRTELNKIQLTACLAVNEHKPEMISVVGFFFLLKSWYLFCQGNFPFIMETKFTTQTLF